jgi:hypothetical protein
MSFAFGRQSLEHGLRKPDEADGVEKKLTGQLR